MSVTVSCNGLRKDFREDRSIGPVSFSAHSGEMIALMGPSGSGKSTVLNMIGLLEKPSAGALELFGANAPAPNTRRANLLLKKEIGYLFQNYALIDSDSVSHNLAVALPIARGKSKECAEALSELGLSGYEERKVYELSGGEQQRVALARLLVKPCNLILADEPTGSLDSANRQVVAERLRAFCDADKTVIVATHDDWVARKCDRVIELN